MKTGFLVYAPTATDTRGRHYMQNDKLLHLVAGLSIVLYLSMAFIMLTRYDAVFIAIVSYMVATFVGLSKEVYDKLSKKGTPEVMDFLMTALGAILGLVYILLVV